MVDHTAREIHHQPQAWAETLSYLEANSSQFLSFLAGEGEEVIFTGCGTSYNLSLSAAALWQTLAQTPARAVPASQVFLFPQTVFVPGRKYRLFAISRSGETSETVQALNFFKKNNFGQGCALTCEAGSSLSQTGDLVIVTASAREESVVMTQSFSTMLLSLLYLAGRQAKKELKLSLLPEILSQNMETYEPMVRELARNLSFQKFIFLGNGPYYGIAWEGSLKLKEMSLTPTETFHFLEFRHGPKSIVDDHTLIIALTSQQAFSPEQAVLLEMMELGATIFHIGSSRLSPSSKLFEIALDGEGINDYTLPILDVAFLQLLGYYRAQARGLNPDQPKNLTKVVKL
ncbi:MAG: hypothetical protein PWP04_729 [Candidatus Atribacteria bacterium]|nr:hypothetical protein [Candidatus Atribacteria bacterium]